MTNLFIIGGDKPHKYPLGTLVDVKIEKHESGYDCGTRVSLSGECRLLVVAHVHGGDGIPLYVLSDIPVVASSKTFDDNYLRYMALCELYEIGIPENELKPTGDVINLFQTCEEWMVNGK